jgi:hypothetical protein
MMMTNRILFAETAPSERTVSIADIAELVRSRAVGLRHSVDTFKKHPTYDSRKNLLARWNEVAGMFSLLLQLNGYKEIKESDVREQVTYARVAVESLYGKPGRKTSEER